MDFGVSRLVGQTLTKVTSLIGTPGYLAPEVAAGQQATAKADVYSLGVLSRPGSVTAHQAGPSRCSSTLSLGIPLLLSPHLPSLSDQCERRTRCSG